MRKGRRSAISLSVVTNTARSPWFWTGCERTATFHRVASVAKGSTSILTTYSTSPCFVTCCWIIASRTKAVQAWPPSPDR